MNLLTFSFLLILTSIVFYIIFSYERFKIFLLTLKSYYLFLISFLVVFSLYELLLQDNLYILLEYKYSLFLSFFTSVMIYGLFEGFIIKNIDKAKLEYIFSSTYISIPMSMFILLICKNYSLLYILLFSRHSLLVTSVILASTLLELYFGVFSIIGIGKAYNLSIYKHKNQILSMQYNLQVSHLKHLEDYQSDIRRISHDIHNHKTVLYNLIKEEEYDTALKYLESYGTGFNNKKYEILTNNKMLNALLIHKKDICNSNNINLELDINIPSDLGLSDFDLCIIVGNLTDNAIEACKKISYNTTSYIKIKSTIINENFIFDIKNNFIGNISINKGKILTSKKDKVNNGLGLSNVKSTVDKLNGTYYITYQDNEFSSLIMIPLYY